MRQTKLTLLVLAAFLALVLGGCGSNRDSGGDQTVGPDLGTDPDTGIAFVGAATCIGCHEDISFSQELVQGYLQSKHVNHSTSINAASPASCLECHDPLGDGPGLEAHIDPANVPAEGLAAVGCENCHGPGGEHFGVGPIPTFSPNFEVCGQCHRDLPDVTGFHPEGLNIIGNYQQSAHATGTVRTTAPCFRCHSDEGFRAFVDGTRDLDADNLEEALAAAPPVGDAPIQCRTCHDPHETGTLRVLESQSRITNDPETGDRRFQKSFSSQFRLCTACHQAFLDETFDEEKELFTYELIFDPDDPETNDRPFHGNAAGPTAESNPANNRLIWDTHFFFPAGENTIPGYNINAAEDNACLNCHEVHGATKFPQQANAVTIATQWASSGHADYQGEPFNRQFSSVCMKCHSGTEYVRFLQGVPQAELEAGGGRVIACVACHDLMAKNAEGEFELVATRPVDEVVFPSGAVQDLGDASNLCAECHQGRESGLTVANVIAANPGGPHRFLNRHYFAAAAIRFGTEVTAGFEYPGRTYIGENTYPFHPVSLTTCIGCHLREGTTNHTFEPDITRCQNCHIDSGTFPGTLSSFENLGRPFGIPNIDYDGDGAGESFQGEIDGMEELLLTAIRNYAGATIGTPIAYGPGSYPYWFVDTNNNGTVDEGEGSYSLFDDKLLAAAYNYHSNQDPCGDMHNYRYVLQTAYDSTDDLDDDVLNNSVQGTSVTATRP